MGANRTRTPLPSLPQSPRPLSGAERDLSNPPVRVVQQFFPPVFFFWLCALVVFMFYVGCFCSHCRKAVGKSRSGRDPVAIRRNKFNFVQVAIPSEHAHLILSSSFLHSFLSLSSSSLHLPAPAHLRFFSASENFLSPFLSLTIKYSLLFYFAPLSLTFSHHIEEKQKKMIQLSV